MEMNSAVFRLHSFCLALCLLFVSVGLTMDIRNVHHQQESAHDVTMFYMPVTVPKWHKNSSNLSK